jgi:hypothetical protein
VDLEQCIRIFTAEDAKNAEADRNETVAVDVSGLEDSTATYYAGFYE